MGNDVGGTGLGGTIRFISAALSGGNAFEFNITNSGTYAGTPMYIAADGQVVISDYAISTPSGYKLYVGGGILTEKLKVALSSGTNWSDYVFNKGYKMMSLPELDAFVKKNKHLPGVPSADEVVKDGIDMATMDATLLKKIEELTLYVIQQQKEIDALKKQLKNKK